MTEELQDRIRIFQTFLENSNNRNKVCDHLSKLFFLAAKGAYSRVTPGHVVPRHM
jgi:hypothetical protein